MLKNLNTQNPDVRQSSRPVLNEITTSVLRFIPVVLFFFLSLAAHAQCWLEARGTQMVNTSTGQEVLLRGVNLGAWGLQEGYMLNPQNTNLAGTQWAMK